MQGEWNIVQRRSPVRVVKEKDTGIHYIVDKHVVSDYFGARAVVKLRENYFVFVVGHYSSECEICKKNFDKKYTFVKTMDMNKIQTVHLDDSDERMVTCAYSVTFE